MSHVVNKKPRIFAILFLPQRIFRAFHDILKLLVLSRLGAEQIKDEDYVCLEKRVQCPVVPHCSPQSLHAAMQLVNIQTLAFTPPNTLPWRVYLYTHAHYAGSANTPQSTLILGELLYTGEAQQEAGVKKAAGDGEVMAEGRKDELVKEEAEATADGWSRREMTRKGEKEERIKVTLKQQPRDDKALKGFLSILTTVLHTLSS